MRKAQFEKIAEKVKPGGKVTWFGKDGKRHRRRIVDHDLHDDNNVEGSDAVHAGHVGHHAMEEMLRQTALPEGWEFKNEKEVKELATMKVILKKEFADLAHSVVTLQDGRVVNVVKQFPDVYGDMRLLRFLRKQKTEDAVAASAAYRKFLAWRKANDVDNIRALVETRPFEVPTTSEFVPDFLPFDFRTKGQPENPSENIGAIILLSIGKWRTSELTSLIKRGELSLSDFSVYWIFIFESLHKCLYSESVKQKQMVFVEAISDLKGFSLRQITPAFVSLVLRPWISELQANYPETAKRINVVHPPKVVSLLWKAVNPMISPGTAAKIRIR